MTDLSENELEERFKKGDYVKITNTKHEYHGAIVELKGLSTHNKSVGKIWIVEVLQDSHGNTVKPILDGVHDTDITEVSWFDLC